MKKLAKMNWIILILNLAFFSACASSLDKFPARHMYVVDVTNQVCVKYKITDSEQIKFALVSEVPLAPKGDCDRLTGFHRSEFNGVKNWVRDAIREFKQKAVQLYELMQMNRDQRI